MAKKLLAILLSAIMVASLATTIYAEDAVSSGEAAAPSVETVVPDAGDADAADEVVPPVTVSDFGGTKALLAANAGVPSGETYTDTQGNTGNVIQSAADNINMYLFDYGTRINSSTDAVLLFRSTGSHSEVDRDWDQGHNNGTDNSYRPILSRVLINGYPYVDDMGILVGAASGEYPYSKNDATKNNTDDEYGIFPSTSGSLQYLFYEDGAAFRGIDTNNQDLLNKLATKYPELGIENALDHYVLYDTYDVRNRGEYQSMRFTVSGANGTGLFQKDADGYYSYSATKNAAYFQPAAGSTDTGTFTLYDYVLRPSWVYPEDQLDTVADSYDWRGTEAADTDTYVTFDEYPALMTENLWDRLTGSGFIAEDFLSMLEYTKKGHLYPFNQGHSQGVLSSAGQAVNGGLAYRMGTANPTENLPTANYTDVWYGMAMDFDFAMPKAGQTLDVNNVPQDMMFEFMGDDDVMVYIDGVLVLDISGVHLAEYGGINFATGEVIHPKNEITPTTDSTAEFPYLFTPNTLTDDSRAFFTSAGVGGSADYGHYTLKGKFEEAEKEVAEKIAAAQAAGNDTADLEATQAKIKEVLKSFVLATDAEGNVLKDSQGNDAYIFSNYSEHTLSFYYLERGGSYSYCDLKFNMEALPHGSASVQKVEAELNENYWGQTYTFQLLDGNDNPFSDPQPFQITDPGAFGIADANTEAATAGYYVPDANGYFYLKGQQTAVFNFEDGVQFQVKEIVEDGYEDLYTPSHTVNGVLGAKPAETDVLTINTELNTAIVFTNTWETEDLIVTKQVESDGVNAPGQHYLFDLKIGSFSNQTEPVPYEGPVTLIDATGETVIYSTGMLWLEDGESVRIDGLRDHTVFTLSEHIPENDNEEYEYENPTFTYLDPLGDVYGVDTKTESVGFGAEIRTEIVHTDEHVNTVAVVNRYVPVGFDLKITKRGAAAADADQTFLFNVTNNDTGATMTVAVKGNDSVVIEKLKEGNYTVEEDAGWSWRYSVEGYLQLGFEEEAKDHYIADVLGTSANTFDLIGDKQLVVMNGRPNTQWLDDNSYVENLFTGVAAPEPEPPVSSEPTSSEPESSEPTSSEPESSEPTSSEPESSEPTSSEPIRPDIPDPPTEDELYVINVTGLTAGDWWDEPGGSISLPEAQENARIIQAALDTPPPEGYKGVKVVLPEGHYCLAPEILTETEQACLIMRQDHLYLTGSGDDGNGNYKTVLKTNGHWNADGLGADRNYDNGYQAGYWGSGSGVESTYPYLRSLAIQIMSDRTPDGSQAPREDIHITGFELDGGRSWNGDYDFSYDPLLDKGWDVYHKGIIVSWSGQKQFGFDKVTGVYLEDLYVHRYSGETLYVGGDGVGYLELANCTITDSNASLCNLYAACLNIHDNNFGSPDTQSRFWVEFAPRKSQLLEMGTFYYPHDFIVGVDMVDGQPQWQNTAYFTNNNFYNSVGNRGLTLTQGDSTTYAVYIKDNFFDNSKATLDYASFLHFAGAIYGPTIIEGNTFQNNNAPVLEFAFGGPDAIGPNGEGLRDDGHYYWNVNSNIQITNNTATNIGGPAILDLWRNYNAMGTTPGAANITISNNDFRANPNSNWDGAAPISIATGNGIILDNIRVTDNYFENCAEPWEDYSTQGILPWFEGNTYANSTLRTGPQNASTQTTLNPFYERMVITANSQIIATLRTGMYTDGQQVVVTGATGTANIVFAANDTSRGYSVDQDYAITGPNTWITFKYDAANGIWVLVETNCDAYELPDTTVPDPFEHDEIVEYGDTPDSSWKLNDQIANYTVGQWLPRATGGDANAPAGDAFWKDVFMADYWSGDGSHAFVVEDEDGSRYIQALTPSNRDAALPQIYLGFEQAYKAGKLTASFDVKVDPSERITGFNMGFGYYYEYKFIFESFPNVTVTGPVTDVAARERDTWYHYDLEVDLSNKTLTVSVYDESGALLESVTETLPDGVLTDGLNFFKIRPIIDNSKTFNNDSYYVRDLAISYYEPATISWSMTDALAGYNVGNKMPENITVMVPNTLSADHNEGWDGSAVWIREDTLGRYLEAQIGTQGNMPQIYYGMDQAYNTGKLHAEFTMLVNEGTALTSMDVGFANCNANNNDGVTDYAEVPGDLEIVGDQFFHNDVALEGAKFVRGVWYQFVLDIDLDNHTETITIYKGSKDAENGRELVGTWSWDLDANLTLTTFKTRPLIVPGSNDRPTYLLRDLFISHTAN